MDHFTALSARSLEARQTRRCYTTLSGRVRCRYTTSRWHNWGRWLAVALIIAAFLVGVLAFWSVLSLIAVDALSKVTDSRPAASPLRAVAKLAVSPSQALAGFPIECSTRPARLLPRSMELPPPMPPIRTLDTMARSTSHLPALLRHKIISRQQGHRPSTRNDRL